MYGYEMEDAAIYSYSGVLTIKYGWKCIFIPYLILYL